MSEWAYDEDHDRIGAALLVWCEDMDGDLLVYVGIRFDEFVLLDTRGGIDPGTEYLSVTYATDRNHTGSVRALYDSLTRTVFVLSDDLGQIYYIVNGRMPANSLTVEMPLDFNQGAVEFTWSLTGSAAALDRACTS